MRQRSERQNEKNLKTQQDLLQAARKIVGRVGYASASIARIAEAADVSIGTCYLHFKSKEDLFDQLLPWCNIALSKYVARRTQGASCYMDFEERNIRAFLDYAVSEPSFVRVLIEAEVAAPKGWDDYLSIREADYLRRMTEAAERGEFPDFHRDDLPQVCTMLTGIRRAMVVRYLKRGIRKHPVPNEVIETYIAFVAPGLHHTNLRQILDIWKGPGGSLRSPPGPPAALAVAQ